MSNKVIVDRQFFLTLVEDAILTQATDEDPSFEPDPDMGEGQASQGEHDYRSELLSLLAGVFVPIRAILRSKAPVELKITQIDNQLSTFTSQAENLIGDTLPNTWKEAVGDANTKLRELKPGIRPVNGDPKILAQIEAQQNSNVEDIANYLQGRLTQGLQVDTINEVYGDHQSNIDYLNPAFNNAQTRLDQLGMYGYLKTHHLGMLTGLMAGSLIMGMVLIADWVSMQDDKVCDECQEMEAGSPYSIMEWPEERHFGDRCWMDNIRIEGT